ncbi:MAG: hypothetical protein ACRDJ5_03660 [Actinomycetota bacterium]
MSIDLTYGINDAHGKYIGPWLLLDISSPDGSGCDELLGPKDARALAARLRDAAQIIEARAAARKATS